MMLRFIVRVGDISIIHLPTQSYGQESVIGSNPVFGPDCRHANGVLYLIQCRRTDHLLHTLKRLLLLRQRRC